jgi:aminoglycoside phosphotransferase (APT) family kinase protein
MPAVKMHPDEVDADAALVGRLLAAQFPEWAGLPIEAVAGPGTDNTIYRVGETMAARLPRRAQNLGQLDKELRWLPVLGPRLPLAIPVPLAAGEPGEGYPFGWAVYPWLEGETATVERIGDLAQAAADIAHFVAALQQVDATDAPAPGVHNSQRGAPLSTRDRSTRAAIAALGDMLDVDAVTTVWDAALAATAWEREPVWIHGDLDARNLLAREGRLSAAIDFGCLGAGDPAYDVMVAWKILSADTRDAFRNELSVDDATWTRGRGLALSQAVTALAYYTLETNAVLVREAERWLAEIL